jgi:hypothetical protein
MSDKIDLPKLEVPSSKAIDYATSIGCGHFEVSAKTGEGLDLLFRCVTEALVKGDGSSGKPISKRRTKRALNVLDADAQESADAKDCNDINPRWMAVSIQRYRRSAELFEIRVSFLSAHEYVSVRFASHASKRFGSKDRSELHGFLLCFTFRIRIWSCSDRLSRIESWPECQSSQSMVCKLCNFLLLSGRWKKTLRTARHGG